MTREEAIKELEEDKALYMPDEWIECVDRDTPDGRLITALDMAIKAFEQESCEDAISRAQAIKECYSIPIDGETFDVVQVETLMGLPSVTPKKKMGHWELPEMAYDANIWRKCSCCGVHYECFTKYEPKSPSMYAGETFYSRKQLNFCPNCGADMREI